MRPPLVGLHAFRVTRLSGVLPTLKAVAGPDGRPQFDPPSISLSVDPGSPREWITGACTDGESNGRILWPTYSPGSGYAGVFDALYAAQSDGSSFRIDGWDFLGGSVYARKTYERSKAAPAQNQPFSTWTDDERTTYDLRHTLQS